mmetsp:Transcript_29521/g.83272  ORF Transcript_29521/g.83272 Transcript_29521/m.83272 type:complete len:298 (+) Transcript_29521:531-1424(+)|eukprot:CAMPEP_0117668316 /NCGR_PEP_ID=MMETSP0804-20121206/11476_1 /TAXON_ID=1074897 /ORGANISM="Tetraselmis astigmatica, Strain CCMP880" /LENGTH=297 /DNA_ID=CAMNT_0005476183 /DNA_START=490 /DNA_END=1383 /DNA_ORIENTATION=+
MGQLDCNESKINRPERRQDPASSCPASALPPDLWQLIFTHLWFADDGSLDETSGSRDTASARLACSAFVEPAATATLCLRPKSLETVSYQRYPHLLRLSLDRIKHRACSVSDSHLSQLSSLTTLRSLDIGSCTHVTDLGLASLASLTRLTTLDMSCCHRVTAAGLASLRPLGGLQNLSLEWCFIGDSGVEALQNLTGIVSLNLSDCSLSDAALRHIQTLPNLASLDVSRNFQLTSSGIQHLHSMSSLRWIDLTSCSAVSSQAARTLSSCQQNNQIQVHRWRMTPWHPTSVIRHPVGS